MYVLDLVGSNYEVGKRSGLLDLEDSIGIRSSLLSCAVHATTMPPPQGLPAVAPRTRTGMGQSENLALHLESSSLVRGTKVNILLNQKNGVIKWLMMNISKDNEYDISTGRHWKLLRIENLRDSGKMYI